MNRDELRAKLLDGYDQLLNNTVAAFYFRRDPNAKRVVEAQRQVYATSDAAVDQLLAMIQSLPARDSESPLDTLSGSDDKVS